MRVGGTMTRENGPEGLSSICSIMSRAALMPISRRDQLTVVIGTRSMSMCAMPPAPTIERSSGTRQPFAKAALRAPMAAKSLATNTAVTSGAVSDRRMTAS